MAGEQGYDDGRNAGANPGNVGDMGAFFRSLFSPTMSEGMVQPVAPPIAPGTPMNAPGVSPVGVSPAGASPLGRRSAGPPTGAQGPLPGVPPGNPMATVANSTTDNGAAPGGIPWQQLLTAVIGAGGGGALLDALMRSGRGGTTVGNADSANTLHGEALPPEAPTYKSGPLQTGPTIEGTLSPEEVAARTIAQGQPGQLEAPSQRLEGPQRARLAAPQQQIAAPQRQLAAPQPEMPRNEYAASLGKQSIEGGMPQLASGEQAKIGTYYGDNTVPNTSRSPTHAEGKTTRVDGVIKEELAKRSLSMENLPASAQKRLTDPSFLARAGASPSALHDLRMFLRGIKFAR